MLKEIKEPQRTLCGERIPFDNIHAVSVSLPQLTDVIGYEEKRTETLSRLKSGYPRFVAHSYIARILDYNRETKKIDTPQFILSSKKAGETIVRKFGIQDYRILEDEGIVTLVIPNKADLEKEILAFIQHTGCLASSRKAEDFLVKKGILQEIYREKVEKDSPVEKIFSTLSSFYSEQNPEILLSVSGMNGIYTAFESLDRIRKKQGKTIWIRLGWLYVDNIRILEKYTSDSYVIHDATDLKELETFLETNSEKVAGIITECPTNPLLLVPDYTKLKTIVDRYGIPLIADISVAGSAVIDVLPFTDIVVESLTKFACGNGDLMMGCVVLNRNSKWYSELSPVCRELVEEPYLRDCERLAYEIKDYEQRVLRISENVQKLAAFFTERPGIRNVFWTGSKESSENFSKIARIPGIQSGVLSIELSIPLEKFYDRLALLKGPSFGTEFTLNMLYVYLAHYELATTDEGKKFLKENGLDPNLIRISVGIENPDLLIEEYKKALED
ncbi:aminotransferase class I/II-fold pyridoxal phosphate-dependent enzyme [Leptospira ellisii]|uniref:Aminotransferase class I/II-fold pyridoxal phosphate-dependent enzyme n=1 Tax=Leptospira ellisii TaxID=2023197 RepID=A0A2N0BIJ9_9LEPT|nr:PLP-dependent transferase [Leptospira ellisii]MDV6234112.1 aminotransferase class I/II-fold pyridoxal phosphate-dependent enzyme [Leptospira ellisii]PJZ92244.1 Cys/Met metabolism PLP-dependent enzyme [Leptospira ellisii]PKA03694.1 Cys/Met metabolism PLP-dependent enzyme [Leptospira ellisii]